LNRWEPRLVAGTVTFERVSAGGRHSCGETRTNQVYCWGNNLFGELGDGTTTRRLTPVPVAGGRFFRQLSVGHFYTCAVSAADAAGYCWGKNEYGTLGDGTRIDRSTPTPVAGPS
jgi:alpha-tubulin suppressor-like RCC1 family protein